MNGDAGAIHDTNDTNTLVVRPMSNTQVSLNCYHSVNETCKEEHIIMMYIEVSHNDWNNSLNEYFSYEAIELLKDYYDELAEDADIAFDPVGIRCEWSEYDAEDLIRDYGYLLNETSTTDSHAEFMGELIETIQDRTICMELDNGNYLVHEF